MRIARSVLLALLFSLLFGLAVGTWLRVRLEQTPVYIGAVASDRGPGPPATAALEPEPPTTPEASTRPGSRDRASRPRA